MYCTSNLFDQLESVCTVIAGSGHVWLNKPESAKDYESPWTVVGIDVMEDLQDGRKRTLSLLLHRLKAIQQRLVVPRLLLHRPTSSFPSNLALVHLQAESQQARLSGRHSKFVLLIVIHLLQCRASPTLISFVEPCVCNQSSCAALTNYLKVIFHGQT